MTYKSKRPPVFNTQTPKKPGDLILTSTGWITVK